MTSERKNYASMARSKNLSYGEVYIKKDEANGLLHDCENTLISLIKNAATKENQGFLIIDFTLFAKQFSEHIPDVTYDYNGVDKRVTKGFSAGFIIWSNGSIAIPFNFNLWLRKKDAGDLYKKKTDLTKELIKLAQKSGIPFAEIKLDGAFASQEMLIFLKTEGINCTLRMPANRVISTEQFTNQLSKHPELKLRRNEKYKTVFASYKGVFYYFTAHKRKGQKNTKEVVYIISDVTRSAKGHIESYGKRWPGEKVFRTGKQHLGFTNCQSTNATKQRLHIFLVMISYAILGFIKIYKKKKSIEEVLHLIRRQKMTRELLVYLDLEATFMN